MLQFHTLNCTYSQGRVQDFFLYAGLLQSGSGFPKTTLILKAKNGIFFFCFSLRAAKSVKSSGNYTISASKAIYHVKTDNTEIGTESTPSVFVLASAPL